MVGGRGMVAKEVDDSTTCRGGPEDLGEILKGHVSERDEERELWIIKEEWVGELMNNWRVNKERARRWNRGIGRNQSRMPCKRGGDNVRQRARAGKSEAKEEKERSESKDACVHRIDATIVPGAPAHGLSGSDLTMMDHVHRRVFVKRFVLFFFFLFRALVKVSVHSRRCAIQAGDAV
jgi:hypothetical protein